MKDHIVQILLRYDVSTVQEIRESSGASFPKLVADMNSIAGDIYDFHVGARQASVRYVKYHMKNTDKVRISGIFEKPVKRRKTGYFNRVELFY